MPTPDKSINPPSFWEKDEPPVTVYLDCDNCDNETPSGDMKLTVYESNGITTYNQVCPKCYNEFQEIKATAKMNEIKLDRVLSIRPNSADEYKGLSPGERFRLFKDERLIESWKNAVSVAFGYGRISGIVKFKS